MKRQTRTMNTQYRTDETDGKKHICGYFVVFGDEYQVCENGTESVDRHAFDGALNDDIRMLVDHDSRLVIGRNTAGTMTLKADDVGLWADAVLNEDDTDATNVYARLQRGDVNQASFGFDILDESREVRADGSVHWTIKSVKLYEVSVCTFPAYKATSVEARSDDMRMISEQRSFDAWKANILNRLGADEHGTETAGDHPADAEPEAESADAE